MRFDGVKGIDWVFINGKITFLRIVCSKLIDFQWMIFIKESEALLKLNQRNWYVSLKRRLQNKGNKDKRKAEKKTVNFIAFCRQKL